MPTDEPFLTALAARPIGPGINLDSFRCNDAIDWFLKTQARDHHGKRITTVTCWMDGPNIAGYVTTSMTEIVLEDSTARAAARLDGVMLRERGKHWHRFPALLIGMLGVSEQYRRRGLGEHMVKFALGQAHACCSAAACRFVAVDSDDTQEATGMYKKVGFATVKGKDRGTVRMHYDLGPR